MAILGAIALVFIAALLIMLIMLLLYFSNNPFDEGWARSILLGEFAYVVFLLAAGALIALGVWIARVTGVS